MSGYDYVIVGAGSAGCVVAERVTEDPAISVALIEAGGPDASDEVHLPIAWGELFKGPYDWDLDSDPEPGADDRRIFLPRGKVLGGSSSINAMIYIRGARADYDGWAQGSAPGWNFDQVLPYFVKSEDNERGADQYHGVGGPLSVSDSRSKHPLSEAFISAGVEAGYKQNVDFNASSQDGVGFYQVTQRDGMRCSTADAFLRPAMGRPNLHVFTFSVVHRVLFDGDRAVGVEVRRGSDVEIIRAEREVILSAGAYESPKILMLSGIGPARHLESLDVPVYRDLPVGEGLQDHFFVMVNYLTNVETLEACGTDANLALLESEGRGPLTSNGAEAGGFFRTLPGLAAPDVQVHMAPVMSYHENMGTPTAPAFALGPSAVAPSSRGLVTLRSPNPESAPRILHNYLASEEDRASLIAGLRLTLDIARQPALSAKTIAPFEVPESESDADLLSFARHVGQSLYHPTSTCAIGSVVDNELCVFGAAGLRVVDASVMPTSIRGNTNAPTIMIAERAADLILRH